MALELTVFIVHYIHYIIQAAKMFGYGTKSTNICKRLLALALHLNKVARLQIPSLSNWFWHKITPKGIHTLKPTE